MVWISNPVKRISGHIIPPGDKSCSHRAILFAAMAEGTSYITGLLEGDDVLRTGEACRKLGAEVTRTGKGAWTVTGKGGFEQPSEPIDFGNSGTGSRLMMGAMGGYDIKVEITGDASLSSRPMGRVLNPLYDMGVTAENAEDGKLPLTLIGSSTLKAIDYTPPVASAQVKSCVLLAGLNAVGTTYVRETKKTRDHTERMLEGFGVALSSEDDGEGQVVSIKGGQKLKAGEFVVPSDPSSAAFLLAAGLVAPASDVTIEGHMTNPTRSGFLKVIEGMADVELTNERTVSGETVVDVKVSRRDGLNATNPPVELVPAMIDEFPIFAVLAAFAKGETHVTGAEELRVKESDRIRATVDLLRVNGVKVDEHEDGFTVYGCDGKVPGGGTVETRHDHRIAMSALVMGIAAENPVAVDDIAMIATSYPEFFDHMKQLGADIREA
ncbi:3-phosphoshikimate 1-carboxyvinyltransferase [Ponticaulis sp.]|uniref:3-phosphoshikimate 1-carboxyvinyltransferase n=1 Tax=Ponticaulis sp. TaxID=2020902 RepID=UPI000B7569B8|nr:3-phosphoshikimate 1-carboxyvinyltransferase [Ponticaulis sp.]MAI89353.1 3-phosphoshikimate 1-carboxyvinyltransferase [Ponticaulis sp.]OUY00941.1 MAG: 3-phosphoshikimate 1-carboxyvinyltransferase [Hyphomonadaceae bacterium TMED5]